MSVNHRQRGLRTQKMTATVARRI